MALSNIFSFIPEVKKPLEKKVSFNVKIKWTIIILVSFFVLANIPLFGLSENALERFEYLAIILGTDFGSIISLGIGPIVMASIILQLLTGSGLLNIDTNTTEGKKLFQGLQKLLVLFFIIFESIVYVMFQGLQADPGFAGLVIFQLIIGGLAIYYMSEVSEKWGFTSGVSLFIAAGVSWRLFTSAFQFIDENNKICLLNFKEVSCSGRVLSFFQEIILQHPTAALSAAVTILITVFIFLIIVWAQSLKVEIPLSFGKIRGYNIKWPLSFFYASVIPVILTAALIANIQLFGGIIENAAAPCLDSAVIENSASCSGMARFSSYFTWLGHFVEGNAVSGLAFWMGSTNLLDLIIRGGFLPKYLFQGITHILFFTFFSTIFAFFWVKTSGMDAKAQAKKIASSGLQVSGFRQDIRILESILDRYVIPLTIMGGIAIGLLASITDLVGALISGTAMLLVIMIIFQLYQGIAQQHSVDMNPTMKKLIKG
jgi:preprotein translocase subunit SecY